MEFKGNNELLFSLKLSGHRRFSRDSGEIYVNYMLINANIR